jgi:hypothetical protein
VRRGDEDAAGGDGDSEEEEERGAGWFAAVVFPRQRWCLSACV